MLIISNNLNMRIINVFYGYESYVNKYLVIWIKKNMEIKKGYNFYIDY